MSPATHGRPGNGFRYAEPADGALGTQLQEGRPALRWWVWGELSTLPLALLAVLVGTTGKAEVPSVVFDVPLITECRDVTPQGFREAYKREVIEAVFRISPQLLAGDEKDIKRLHYEISTEEQMPVISYLPSAQVATDVVDGTIAIQNSSRHGEVSFRYLILPNTGNGDLKGDLESSHAQFGLLAPRQLLVAAGTIDRGCGVYFELRPSSQDTLQKQREFACVFEVPLAWRADYVTIRCKAKGMKRGFGGLLDAEVPCGAGLLCIGLYKQDDGEAREYANMVARKQQAYLSKLAEQTRPSKGPGMVDPLGALDRLFSGSKAKAKVSRATAIGAAIQSEMEEGRLSSVMQELPSRAGGMKSTNLELEVLSLPSQETQAAGDELKTAKEELRRMNGRKE